MFGQVQPSIRRVYFRIILLQQTELVKCFSGAFISQCRYGLQNNWSFFIFLNALLTSYSICCDSLQCLSLCHSHHISFL
ncbi:hypothetical protein FGO68_gene3534 [Halteria grandinella]|uniref:Uncharacterized protein n=1 Tax=Halteria grandinella TaxID=5974 RepID=A0A8J8T5Y7_HALGN|nr:hypothetical protein FGO68_gene3534 [Halteria grandinella]